MTSTEVTTLKTMAFGLLSLMRQTEHSHSRVRAKMREAYTEDALKGVLVDTSVPEGAYIYVGGTDNAWKKVTSTNPKTVGANKAYLDLSNISTISQAEAASYGARMRAITIGGDGETTGIETVEKAEQSNDATYTLGGVRTNNTKGIRINKNKKYIVK